MRQSLRLYRNAESIFARRPFFTYNLSNEVLCFIENMLQFLYIRHYKLFYPIMEAVEQFKFVKTVFQNNRLCLTKAQRFLPRVTTHMWKTVTECAHGN